MQQIISEIFEMHAMFFGRVVDDQKSPWTKAIVKNHINKMEVVEETFQNLADKNAAYRQTPSGRHWKPTPMEFINEYNFISIAIAKQSHQKCNICDSSGWLRVLIFSYKGSYYLFQPSKANTYDVKKYDTELVENVIPCCCHRGIEHNSKLKYTSSFIQKCINSQLSGSQAYSKAKNWWKECRTLEPSTQTEKIKQIEASI